MPNRTPLQQEQWDKVKKSITNIIYTIGLHPSEKADAILALEDILVRDKDTSAFNKYHVIKMAEEDFVKVLPK